MFEKVGEKKNEPLWVGALLANFFFSSAMMRRKIKNARFERSRAKRPNENKRISASNFVCRSTLEKMLYWYDKVNRYPQSSQNRR
jgi:hypothetical protein